MTGKRNRDHTLVAHHQVCRTLKENKSTVSREQGIMGSCVTLTQAGIFFRVDVCVYLSAGIYREEWDGKKEEGGTDKVTMMSIESTKAGCNASSVTY